MQQKDLDQVHIIIQNIHQNKKVIPYFHNLAQHSVYGPFFQDLESEDILVIQEYITTYIYDYLQGLKTKGGEMVRRCFALHKDDFRRFRELNSNENNVATEEFQMLGKSLEQAFYKFEGILTQNMMKKPQGLDKTISAYYDIVYSIFPLMNQVQ